MNQNKIYRPIGPTPIPNNGDRFIGGGFLAPFLLGGITGGLLAPSFYPRPFYGPPVAYPVPTPYPVYTNQVPYTQNQYYYYN